MKICGERIKKQKQKNKTCCRQKRIKKTSKKLALETSHHALLSLTYSYYLISNKIQSIKSFHTIKEKSDFTTDRYRSFILALPRKSVVPHCKFEFFVILKWITNVKRNLTREMTSYFFWNKCCCNAEKYVSIWRKQNYISWQSRNISPVRNKNHER